MLSEVNTQTPFAISKLYADIIQEFSESHIGEIFTLSDFVSEVTRRLGYPMPSVATFDVQGGMFEAEARGCLELTCPRSDVVWKYRAVVPPPSTSSPSEQKDE